MAESNPFRSGWGIEYAVADRLQMIRGFGRRQCLAAIRLPHVQKTVRIAAERRLRKLNRPR